MLRFAVHRPGNPVASPHSHRLDADHLEPARQISADLLTPVFSGVSLPGPKPGGGESDLGPAVAATFRAGQPALQQAQAPFTRLAQPGTVQQFSSRQRCAYGHAAVHANDLAGARAWDGLGNRSERHVPPTRAVQGDPERLHTIGDDAGPPEPDPAAFRDEHLPRFPVQPAHAFGSDRNDTESFVAYGLAPCRLAVGASEEVLHGLVKVAERLLLHHLTAGRQPCVFPPRSSQLPALLQVARRVHPARTPPRLLLAGEVPHKASVRAMLAQDCFLSSRRNQAITRHTKTLASTPDTPEEVKRRVIPCPSIGIATPRTR